MFKGLKRYRLKERPYSLYARRKMDKAAKKAGFAYAAKHGGAYYVEDMKRDNISSDALRVVHYLHDSCTNVGRFNETLCVTLYADGEIKTEIHLIGECPHCHYYWTFTSGTALKVKDAREGTNKYSRRYRLVGW